MSGAAKPTRPIEALHPTAAFSKNAIVTGVHPITIGANSIIQLRAKLDSAHGSITIGERCIIAERAVLGLQSKAGVDSKGIFLGNGVVIQSGARVEGSLGEGTTVEPGAVVEKGSVVGKISSLCSVTENDVLPDYTIVYGSNQRRTEKKGLESLRAKAVERHIEVLKKT